MEWTREKTLALINEYRKRRGLWDMTHDDYRKKEMKQKLLIEVSSSLGGGIPIIEIEKKFHTLRTQYHREINRMKRKEPYNSKWFGFKNLQFLSSPKACRSKGRVTAKEITEEGGIVTTKYIIREATATPYKHDISSGSNNSSVSLANEEFLTIHTKPAPTTTITYEMAASSGGGGGEDASAASSAAAAAAAAATAASARAHELEKLIEETTKDVDEHEEERKPKMIVKQLGAEHQQSHHNSYDGEAGELSNAEEEHLLIAQDQQTQEDDEAMETEELGLNVDEEIAYQSSSSTGGGGGGANNNNTLTVVHHQAAIPTRIIKIQKRDISNDGDYYEQHHHLGGEQHHHQQQQQPPQSYKRIQYEANGQQHMATLLAPTTTQQQPNANSTLINPSAIKLHHLHHRNASMAAIAQAQPKMSPVRDELATYGEYVANEMRGITDRQILVALKHKINTALFEASMAELQK